MTWLYVWGVNWACPAHSQVTFKYNVMNPIIPQVKLKYGSQHSSPNSEVQFDSTMQNYIQLFRLTDYISN